MANPADELLPTSDSDSTAPWDLLAELTAADAVACAALKRELLEAGFHKVAITMEGIGKLKVEVVLHDEDFGASDAFGRLEQLLTNFGLALQEHTLEMEISRNLTSASFVCLRTT